MNIIELSGWYGALAIMSAYFMGSFGYLKPDSKAYQLLNFTGAVGIVVVSVTKSAWQPAVLNLIWSVIALLALIKIFCIKKVSDV